MATATDVHAGYGHDSPAPDRDLVGKLFSAGYTILGIGFPVMTAALVALRNQGLSTLSADALRGLVWLLLPAVVICAVQSVLCLGTLAGVFNLQRLAVIATFLLLIYMMTSVVGWALFTLLA